MRALNLLLEDTSMYVEAFIVNSRMFACSVSLNASISMDLLRIPLITGESSMGVTEGSRLWVSLKCHDFQSLQLVFGV